MSDQKEDNWDGDDKKGQLDERRRSSFYTVPAVDATSNRNRGKEKHKKGGRNLVGKTKNEETSADDSTRIQKTVGNGSKNKTQFKDPESKENGVKTADKNGDMTKVLEESKKKSEEQIKEDVLDEQQKELDTEGDKIVPTSSTNSKKVGRRNSRIRKRVRRSTLTGSTPRRLKQADRSYSAPIMVKKRSSLVSDNLKIRKKQQEKLHLKQTQSVPVKSQATQSTINGPMTSMVTKGTKKRMRLRVKKPIIEKSIEDMSSSKDPLGPQISSTEREKGNQTSGRTPSGHQTQSAPRRRSTIYYDTKQVSPRRETQDSNMPRIGSESRSRLFEKKKQNEGGLKRTNDKTSYSNNVPETTKGTKMLQSKHKESDIDEESVIHFSQVESADVQVAGSPKKSFDYLKRHTVQSESTAMTHKKPSTAQCLSKAALGIEVIIVMLSFTLHTPYLAGHDQELGLHMGIWRFCRGSEAVPFRCYNWSLGTEPEMPIYATKIPKIHVTRALLFGHHFLVVFMLTCLGINLKALQPILCVAWMTTTCAISQAILMMTVLWLICALFDYDMFWIGWAMYCGIVGFILHYVQIIVTYQISNMEYWGYEVDFQPREPPDDKGEGKPDPRHRSRKFPRTKLGAEAGETSQGDTQGADL